MERKLTGWHVLAIFVGAFAVIIGVNVVLAWKAVSTFPGIEVANGYVASQSFDQERRDQVALGWEADTQLVGNILRVRFSHAGRPADVASVEGIFGRATEAADDQTPRFARVADATFEAPVVAARGEWVFQLRAVAGDGTPFRQRVSVTVP